MSKPDFEPQAGKVWAVRIYPGGRRHWVQVEENATVLYFVGMAAEELLRGAYVHVADENIAYRSWLKFRKIEADS